MRDADAFRHIALLYEGERGFIDATAAFLREGIAASEPALAVVSARKIDLLRDELGDLAHWVTFADMAQVGRNPGAIVSTIDDFVRDGFAEGQRVRMVGEPVWAARSADELVECHHHEAVLNVAFADAAGFSLLCPYDCGSLTTDLVDRARQTHPLLSEHGAERRSTDYTGESIAAAQFDGSLAPPPPDAYEVAFDADSLAAMRSFVGELARDAGLAPERREDLLLAVNEVATNSVRHGGGEGVLRAWSASGFLLCEISDSGRIAAPMTGRVRPPTGGLRGYGLWMVNQLCDLVQVRASAAGSTVGMRIRRG
jgi:anti-sigma regulatory factor (Ser/Thr protein kinase)